MKTSKIKSLLAIMAIMVSFPLTSFAQVRVSGKVVDKILKENAQATVEQVIKQALKML